MKGIRINFTGKPRLDFETPVTGRAANAQNAAIGFITSRSTTDMFPTRGTTLFTDSVTGVIVDSRSAHHACNFAALDTLNFSQQFPGDVAADDIAAITAKPTGITDMRLQVQLTLTDASGAVIYTTI